jgi:DNA-binding NarL/FixJ family response regulator
VSGPVPIRLIVADDQASVREGLVVLLDLLPDIDVVGSAANGEDAVALARQLKPDVILLDLHMPVLDGIGATRQLTEHQPETAVVVLTTYADDTSVLAALKAGARSYLTKDADRSEIAQAVRGAAAGLSVMDSAVQATLLRAAAVPAATERRAAVDLPDGLTQREAEILVMIARGMSNPEIAAELFVSSHTVKSHINRVFAKTGSVDRAAAIRYARDHDLA